MTRHGTCVNRPLYRVCREPPAAARLARKHPPCELTSPRRIRTQPSTVVLAGYVVEDAAPGPFMNGDRRHRGSLQDRMAASGARRARFHSDHGLVEEKIARGSEERHVEGKSGATRRANDSDLGSGGRVRRAPPLHGALVRGLGARLSAGALLYHDFCIVDQTEHLVLSPVTEWSEHNRVEREP